MAIINGNADFNLKCTRSGKMGISISWSKKGGIGYNGSVQVWRSDGKLVHTESYAQTTEKGTFVYKAQYLGEYKVSISSNNNNLRDHAFVPVHITTIETATKTFTAKDVQDYNNNSVLQANVFALIGVLFRLTSTILTLGMGYGSTVDTRVSFPAPRVGDKIVTTLTPKTGGFETAVVYNQKAYTDSHGNKQSAATYKMTPTITKYGVYPR